MYCQKIWRNCKYFDLCNSNVDNNFISNDEYDRNLDWWKIHNSLFELWIKSIIKLENYTKDNISSQYNHIDLIIPHEKQVYVLDWYEKEWKKFYAILIWKNKVDINKYILMDSFRDSDLSKWIILTWKMLWYPECCIKWAIKYYKFWNMRDRVFSEWEVCPLLSDKISLFVHNPCSNKCIQTIENSEKVLEYIWKKYWNNIVKYYFDKVKL